MRLAIVTAVCCSMIGLAGADSAKAAMKMATDIPAEGLGPALKEFAHERGLQIVFRTEVVGSVRTRGARGDLTTSEALTRLLEGTNLAYSYLDENTVTILTRTEAQSGSASDGRTPSGGTSQEGQKRDYLRLAQVAQGSSSTPSSVAAASEGGKLEEILVTAQKKEERLQDVPAPITVVNTEQLVEFNQLRLQDFYSQIPGLNVQSERQHQEVLSLFGIGPTIGGSSATVGVLLDDMPLVPVYGFSSTFLPDIDPSDLTRIEVLPGPQGTLYGSSTMGGLVKYVTLDPSTDGFSGRAQAGTSGVYKGAEAGYNFRASLNIPITDKLAVRVSGFTREEPGYIDDIETGQKGINEERVSGAHVSALWRPTNDWSLRLSAIYQDAKADGQNDADAGLGDLQQERAFGSEVFHRQIQAYGANLGGKLGDVDVKVITAYNRTRDYYDSDFSAGVGSYALSNFGVGGVTLPGLATSNQFSQEIRFSGTLWQRLDWVLGGFHSTTHESNSDTLTLEDPVTGMEVPGGASLVQEYELDRYTESAGFADLTYHFTDRFDVQVGGRESHVTNGTYSKSTGVLIGGLALMAEHDTTANVFTYLVTPEFKLSQDVMVYVRAASGYRAGGYNNNSAIAEGLVVPPNYAPDKTYTYSAGVKGDFIDHRLFIDANLYYVDWKNIQLSVFGVASTGGGYGYVTNAGGAKSEGAQLSVTARPLAGLMITGWIDYDNAVLTQAFPADSPTVGASGDRLPYDSRWSGNVSVTQDFPLWGSATGFVGGAVSVVGNRLGSFQMTPERPNLPSYNKIDLRTGVKYGTWVFDIYTNNVTDQRGLISSGSDYFFGTPNARVYIQPRTVGLNIAKTF